MRGAPWALVAVACGLSIAVPWALAGSPRAIHAGRPPWHHLLGGADAQRMGGPPALVSPSLRLRGGAIISEMPDRPRKPLSPGAKSKIDRKKRSRVRLKKGKGKTDSKAEARRKRKVEKRSQKGKRRPSARAGDGGGKQGHREMRGSTGEGGEEEDGSGEESGEMRDDALDEVARLRVAMNDPDGAARINATELKALAAKMLPPENILRPFWDPQGKGRDLASKSPARRKASEDKLMHALKAAQYGSSKAHSNASMLAGQRHPHLSYALERLVRGMSSTRDCAGEGFCNALRRLLEEFPPSLIPPQEVLALMDKHLNFTSTKMMRSELIELAGGHLNGVLALAQGLPLEARTDIIMCNLCQRLLSIIVRMGASKELSLAAAELFADLVTTIDPKSVEKMVLPRFAAALGTTDRDLDPIELLMILRLQRNVTDRTTSVLSGWIRRAGRLLSDPSHVGKLAKTLANATRPENEGVIHPVWEDAVLEACRGEKESTMQAVVQTLWSRCAEPMRTSLRMQILAHFTQYAPWASLARIISTHTASGLVLAASQGGSVASAAKNVCSLLEGRFAEGGRQAEREREVVLRALVEAHTHFDARMGMRLVSAALSRLGVDACWNHITVLAEELLSPRVRASTDVDGKGKSLQPDEFSQERARRECVDAIAAAVTCMDARQQASKGNYSSENVNAAHGDKTADRKACAELKAAVCKLLARHAFFEGKASSKIQHSSKREMRLLHGTPRPVFAPETRIHMQKKLLSVLSSRQAAKKAGRSETEEEEVMLLRQVDDACAVYEKDEGLKFVVELDEEDKDLRQQVRRLCKRLRSEDGQQRGSALNEVVFRHLGLFKLANPQDPQIHDTIKGLANRCEEALEQGNGAAGMGEKSVCDMVLFLLAQDSHALREVAIRAFRSVVGEMGPESLDTILSVVRTGRVEGMEEASEEDMSGTSQSIEITGSGSGSMSDEESEEDESSKEDVQGQGGGEKKKAVQEKDASEGEEDESDEEGGDTGAEKGKVMAQWQGLDPNVRLSQADSEELRELDNRFIAAQKIKKSALQEEQQALHLRVRCIELVELWAKAHPTSLLLLSHVVPALLDQVDECYSNMRAVRASLHDRVLAVITKTICKGAEQVDASAEGVSSNATALVQDVLERPVHSVEYANSAVGVVCWALRNVDGDDKADCFDFVLDCVNKSMSTRKPSIGLRLMKGIVSKYPSWGLMLLTPVVGFLATARSPFLRLEALSALQSIVTHGEGLRSEGYADSVRKCLNLVGESLLDSVRDLGSNLRKGKPRKEWGRFVMSVAKVLDKGSTSKWSRLASDLRAAVDTARQTQTKGKKETAASKSGAGHTVNTHKQSGSAIDGEEGSEGPESPRLPLGKSFKVSLKLSAEGKREGCVQVS